LPVQNGAQRASIRERSCCGRWATLTAILVGAASAIALPAPAAAATAPMVAASTAAVLGRSTAANPISTSRPFPASVTTQTVYVPASIDSTGASDASAALNSWLRSVPDGSTIVFAANGVYRMDAGLALSSRRNLTLDGNGATLRSNGNGSGGSTLITLHRSSGTTIRNFRLVGNSPTPGVYSTSGEQAHGVRIYSSSGTDISGITVSAVWGDCLYIADASSGVSFHDSQCTSVGLMGVGITSGSNITVERVRFDTIGYGLFDIEPNYASEVTTNVTFRNNTAGVLKQVPGKRFFFGANGASGSTISNVTVTGNTISSSPLDTYVTVARRASIVFANNISTVPATGPVLHFAHVDYLTVTGNVQPLSSGDLANITDCTGATYTSSLAVTPRTGAALAGTAVPLTLTWSGADSTGGTGVARYELAQSRNGGAWTLISTSLTTRSASVTAAPSGTVRYRVRAIDAAGNAGAWAYGRTLAPRLVQQSSTAVRFSSTWTSTSSSSYSGSSAKYAKVAGRSASYTFTGRSIALVAIKAPSRGRVKVYVNGAYIATVDLYRSSTQYRVLAWQKTWSTSATRTVKLVVVGTSGRPKVDLDAFAVVK
jgi:hypothetical protein